MGDFKTGVIRKWSLDANRLSAVTGSSTVYDHPSGILALEAASGGRQYFSDGSAIYRLALS